MFVLLNNPDQPDLRGGAGLGCIEEVDEENDAENHEENDEENFVENYEENDKEDINVADNPDNLRGGGDLGEISGNGGATVR
ncbi:hypothetical protein RF55_24663 [Lasius niger]|uniref:Uncharacterized protein n=1 Tax=Lasius niger TaxID=67767 RepID=A0A0J7MMX3_LASNI|nr:hypothetical protein RF55_24663 [Lasius niger]